MPMRRVALVLVVLFGLALVGGTVATLLWSDAWWIRVSDFPRVQLVVGLLLTTAAFLLLTRRGRGGRIARTPVRVGFAGLLLVCALYLGATIARFTPLVSPLVQQSAPDAPGDTLSLLVANVLMTNREADRLLAEVERWNPDVLLLLEPDAWWERQTRPLEAAYPHTLKAPLDNTYGLLLYSRLPLEGGAVKYLIEPDIPSAHASLRLPSGRTVLFRGLHPRPPAPPEDDDSTERDAELLLVGRALEDASEPAIVAGDLNDVGWSRTSRLFQEVSGLLDPRIGRGFFNTYHARRPLLRWPLDHVFHSDHFTLVEMARLPDVGSDHFPIFIRLRLEPGAEFEQEGPEASPKERERADEQIEKAAEADGDE